MSDQDIRERTPEELARVVSRWFPGSTPQHVKDSLAELQAIAKRVPDLERINAELLLQNAKHIAREKELEKALSGAEADLHGWSVLNTHTDPRESQAMGRRALERLRSAVTKRRSND